MAEIEDTGSVKTPLWFWIVAGLATIWNFFGVVDYLFVRLAPEAYMAQMTPEQVAYFESFPFWFSVIWPIAVFLAFFASVLLLVRKALAFPLFAAALAGFMINSLHSFLLSNGMEVMGVGGFVFTLIIFASLVALTWFSRQWSKTGLLR